MSGYRWVCKECGHESADGPGVLAHHEEAGHIGIRVRFDRDESGGELPPLFRSETLSGRVVWP